MQMNRNLKNHLSLFLSAYMVLFIILSIGLLIVHTNHDCHVHHTHHADQECSVCLHIESLLSFDKEMVFSEVCAGAFEVLLALCSLAALMHLESVIRLTPVTLKVKMNN